MIKYRIPITGLKISTNKFYAGTSNWNKRKQTKDIVLDYAASFCQPDDPVNSYPVEIGYKFIFSSRALDTLNTAIMAKMFEDALCALKILEDDSPSYVRRSSLEVVKQTAQKGKETHESFGQKGNAKNEDWLEIIIKPYESTSTN